VPIDDLWYLKKGRGPNKERLPSKRHGRGRRWRVRYTDAAGEGREKLFDRKADAEAFDLAARTGTAPEVKVGRIDRNITFPDYAEQWREARVITWRPNTRKRIESDLRLHLVPVFDGAARTVTRTQVLSWLTRRLAAGAAESSLRIHFALLDAVMAAAVKDKVIPDNPCDGIKLSQVFRGLSAAPKWVPDEQEVLRLFEVVPERYHGVLWLGAGAGLRIGEALGFEDGPRCLDREHEELHVVQQLRYSPRDYGGFCLTEPKSGSAGTVDLDPAVAAALRTHIRRFPPVGVEVLDETSGTRVRRSVPLLFTTTYGNPFSDRAWSTQWIKWRERAGWPKEHGGFHALRHFFATTLIKNHTDPKEVQRALRHSTLQITLGTYVHFWPRRERRPGVVGRVLQAAAKKRDTT
jgi:integrase